MVRMTREPRLGAERRRAGGTVGSAERAPRPPMPTPTSAPTPVSAAVPGAVPGSSSGRVVGNRDALHLFTSPETALLRCGSTPCDCGPGARGRAAAIGRKVTVSDPGDPSEVEAERVADEVMRAAGGGTAPVAVPPVALTPGAVLTRAVVRPGDLADSVPEEEVAGLGESALPTPSRGPGGVETGVETGVEARFAAARATAGTALPAPVLGQMEVRFGRQFGAVRVHDDARADELSRSVGALAVTTGRDVFFAAGQYRPETPAGQRLLAHELTHVVQQGQADGRVTWLARTSNGALNCPAYDGYDTSKDLATYNCAGLSHRTYDFKSLTDTKALLGKGTAVSASDVCDAMGKVQHWLWEYDMRLEDADGNRGAVSRDFHTVGGPTDGDPLPKEPTDVYTKNGARKVYGPGKGPSFKPAAKDQARTNDPADQPITDTRGRPIYKVRNNFTETSFCLPCPGRKP